MTDSQRMPPKVEVARALLVQGSVFVYLDPRTPGVMVPRHLCRQPQLVLQIGLELVVPIPDLRIDDDGLSGTLSFNRAPFHCRVPWDAVYTLHDDDGMGMVWQSDMPEEVAAEVQAGLHGAKKAKPKRSHLRAVGEPAAEPAAGDAPEPEAKIPARAKPELAAVEQPKLAAVEQPKLAAVEEPRPAESPVETPSEGEPEADRASQRPRGGHLRLVK